MIRIRRPKVRAPDAAFYPKRIGTMASRIVYWHINSFRLKRFFVLAQKTADDLAFGDTAKGNVKPTGRETPAEIARGALENAQWVLSSAPLAISGQQQCFALLPSARLWQQSWDGTNQNILPYPPQSPICDFIRIISTGAPMFAQKSMCRSSFLTCTCEQSGSAKRSLWESRGA
jgi:hypothetical protein